MQLAANPILCTLMSLAAIAIVTLEFTTNHGPRDHRYLRLQQTRIESGQPFLRTWLIGAYRGEPCVHLLTGLQLFRHGPDPYRHVVAEGNEIDLLTSFPVGPTTVADLAGRTSFDSWGIRVEDRTDPTYGPTRLRVQTLYLPTTLLPAILLAWPTCCVLHSRALALIAQRRTLRGLCPRCGYNLTATPTRCPECGHPTPTAPNPTP